MKPLVLWCRWHDAKLRLRGRSKVAVWGELVFAERTVYFQYELASSRLMIGRGADARVVRLDEMGVELTD